MMYYADNVLLDIQTSANFTIAKVEVPETSYKSWNSSGVILTGVMGLVANGEVDLISSLNQLMPQRLAVADFSMPMDELAVYFYIRNPSSKIQILWFEFFKVHKIL